MLNPLKISHRWLLAVLVLLLGSSCRQVTIEVKEVPNNTPRGAQIYVAGNFNNWNPGDPNYVLKYDEKDSVYRVTLPLGIGRLTYKFTRGDWTTVEADICGGDIDDRELLYDESKNVQVSNIFAWHDMEAVDCGRVTLVLDKLPPNTPNNDSIYLTGPFNDWLNKRTDYRFRRDSLGRYIYTFNKQGDYKEVEFKINRGSWQKVEVDKFGLEIPTRKLNFGTEDTLFFQIENWSDLIKGEISNKKVIIIDKMPAYTPSNADLYFAGNINNWDPYNKKFTFNKAPNGKWFFILPPPPPNKKTLGKITFKITRGGWETEEVDADFKRVEDRIFDTDKYDTLTIKVVNWIDYTKIKKANNVVVVLDKYPSNTPLNSIYLTGSFNDWDEEDGRYRFKRNGKGQLCAVVQNVQHDFEYKITLGDWETEAVNEFRALPSNSVYRFGSPDTVYVTVKRWLSTP